MCCTNVQQSCDGHNHPVVISYAQQLTLLCGTVMRLQEEVKNQVRQPAALPCCRSLITRADCLLMASSSRLRTSLALPKPGAPLSRWRPSLGRQRQTQCMPSVKSAAPYNPSAKLA
jgi:hypothetical protein